MAEGRTLSFHKACCQIRLWHRAALQERPLPPGGAPSMTRRSAGQAPARRPLDWSGLGGPERRLSAIEERRGGSGAQCRAWAGAGPRQVRAAAGWGRRAERGPGAGVGWRPAARASLLHRGVGVRPPAGSAAPGVGTRRPASAPSETLREPGASDGGSGRPHGGEGGPGVRVPAGTAASGPGCLSLRDPGVRASGRDPGSPSPAGPAASPGSGTCRPGIGARRQPASSPLTLDLRAGAPACDPSI